MKNAPYYTTIQQLNQNGKNDIPDELISSSHLIYSSPATLAFNSPGAEGFGVKRAGLAVPGSVMLLVAPGCCGRNTRLLSEIRGYEDRFFFLLMDESDIVNGQHVQKVPQAVEEVVDYLEKKPSCVMICSTCIDALLGTDWERVCRKAEERVKIPVRPCYMYALTREGRKPPMVLVRKAIYSMLEPGKKNSRTVNILGYFSPIDGKSEFFDILHQMGIRKVNEISRCRTFSEYKHMSDANFNIVLDAEAREAADDMQKRLNIPYIELSRLYQIDKIHRQYQILAQMLGTSADDSEELEKADQVIRAFIKRHGRIRVSLGEMMNANTWEMAVALSEYGFIIEEIFANLQSDNYIYIRHLAEKCPNARVYTNLSPTMLYYDCSQSEADITIGKDAGYYHPDCPNVAWNDEEQPFGYEGVIRLFQQMEAALGD